MPYRGINAKRNTVHDKSGATIREEAKAHFMNEKKEHDHEFQTAVKTIKKLFNEGFVFQNAMTKKHCVHLNFSNHSGQEEQIVLEYPENLSQLKKHFSEHLSPH